MSSYRLPSSGMPSRSSTVKGRPCGMTPVMMLMVPPPSSAVQTEARLCRFPYFFLSAAESVDSAATKASCGTSTRPIVFIRFLPSFCFSSSLRLRVMSPP